MDIERGEATTWAGWFRALGDPTRILILNLLATAGRPMSVAEIVAAVDVGQSTVSHHLKLLGDVRFVLVEREATSSRWRINERCLDRFPTAAELVMGRLPRDAPWERRANVGVVRPPSAVTLRAMTARDWPVVARIYAAGIATGNATFETSPPSYDDWDASHLPDHRLVSVASGSVVGWAALSPVSDRCAYAGVAENSVYVHPDHRGHGAGSALLDALIASAEAAGIWTIQTGIFPENLASIALHERCGFRIVGRRERIGRLDGVWRDTLLLERRSSRVGVADTA